MGVAYLAGGMMGGGGGLGNFKMLGSRIGGMFGKDKLLGGLVRTRNQDGTLGGLSIGKLGLGALGAASIAPIHGWWRR